MIGGEKYVSSGKEELGKPGIEGSKKGITWKPRQRNSGRNFRPKCQRGKELQDQT
jgi:hypothetical protein